MQPNAMLNQTPMVIYHDPLGPASSSPVSGLSVLAPILNKSPNVVLKLRALVTIDRFSLSRSSEWLTPLDLFPSRGVDVPKVSTASAFPCKIFCEPDFGRETLTRCRLFVLPANGESTPRRKESDTTTLKPPERGDINCPGIIRDMEFLPGVIDLSCRCR